MVPAECLRSVDGRRIVVFAFSDLGIRISGKFRLKITVSDLTR